MVTQVSVVRGLFTTKITVRWPEGGKCSLVVMNEIAEEEINRAQTYTKKQWWEHLRGTK